MTASKKPKTPSMTMTMRRGISEPTIDAFCRKAGRLTLSQIVDVVTVKETLAAHDGLRTKGYSVNLAFYPQDEYQSEYDIQPTEILAAFGAKFPLLLKKEIQHELKRLDQDLKTQMSNVGKGKAVERRHGEGEHQGDDDQDGEEGNIERRDQDEDELSEVGDGDATSAKRKRQAEEQATYDDDSDEEPDGQYDDAAVEAAYAEDEEADPADELKLAAEISAVEETFLQNFPRATSFKFSDSGCTIGLEV